VRLHRRAHSRRASGGTVRPAPGRDSAAFRPLHSATAICCGGRTKAAATSAIALAAFRGAETTETRHDPAGAPGRKSSRRSRGFARPETGHYGRDASHVAQETAVARDAAHGQDDRHSLEPGPLFGAALENCSASLDRPSFVRDFAARLRAELPIAPTLARAARTPSRRSSRPPLCRRRLRIMGWRWRDGARWP